VGVTFDEGQKKQIKTLMAHGHTLAAQKIILRELNSEFKGSAAAQATPAEKAALRTAAGYFKSTIVPVLAQFGRFVSTNIIPAVQKFAQQIGPSLVSAAREAFGFFTANILPVLKQVGSFIVNTVAPAVGKLLVSAFNSLKGALHTIGGAIQSHRAQLAELFSAVRKVAGFVLSVMVPVFKTQLKVAFSIIGHAISILITIIADGVKIFDKIKGAAKAIAGFFTGPFLRAIGTLVKIAVSGFKFMADGFFAAAGTIIHTAAAAFGWVPKLGGKLKGAASAFDAFHNTVDSKLNSMAKQASGWGRSVGDNIGTGLTIGLNEKQQQVAAAAQSLATTAHTKFKEELKMSSPSRLFRQYGHWIVQGLVNGIHDHLHFVDKTVSNISAHIADLPKAIRGWWTQIAKAGESESAHLSKQLDNVSAKFQQTSDAAKQMASNIKQSLTQNTGFANLDEANLTSGVGIATGLKVQFQELRAFTRDLASARKHGLSKAAYNQILAMGPEAGDPILKNLLAHPSSIDSVNRSLAGINRLSSTFASNAAEAKYGKTLEAELTQMKGLRGDVHDLTRAVGTIGKQFHQADQKILRQKKAKQRTKTGSGG
jgi:hypothetical protein